jgi:hypothetical protein
MRSISLLIITFFLTILIIIICIASCAIDSWTATPKDVSSSSRCDPLDEFPQMIQVPGFKSTWQVVHNCNQHPREKTSIALKIFHSEWIQQFGDSWAVNKRMNELMITWSLKTKQGSGFHTDGRRATENSRIYGRVMSPTVIWLSARSMSEPICESALVHELVHISIWALKGTDGDPDHQGTQYLGWTVDHTALIQNVNELLCELGI